MASAASRHFTLQRTTALIQVPLVLWIIVSIIRNQGASRDAFMVWLAEPLTLILMIVLILSVTYHMQLGLGDVIDDYIHKPSSRSLLNALNKVFALLMGAVAFFSVIAITFIV